mgnify:CR=1 FL=1
MTTTEAREALRAIITDPAKQDGEALAEAQVLLREMAAQLAWEAEANEEALWAGLARSEEDVKAGRLSRHEEVMGRLHKRFPHAF